MSDYKNHSILEDNPTHYVIQDMSGNSFPVAKIALDPLTMSKISKLKKIEKMADGGLAGSEQPEYVDRELASEDQKPVDSPIGGFQNFVTSVKADDVVGSKEEGMSHKSPMAQQRQSVPMPQPQAPAKPIVPEEERVNAPAQPAARTAATESVVPGMPGQQGSATKELMGAMDKYGAAQQKIAPQIADTYLKSYEAMKAEQERFNKDLNELNQKTASLVSDAASAKVDPDKYWQNKSTGSKIMAALAMAIGGIGSGITGGPNVALETINKAIDHDIDAQKSNINQKNNLLAQNLELTKNRMLAYERTKSDLTAISLAKVTALEAQNLGPKAKMDLAALKAQLSSQLQTSNTEYAKLLAAMRIKAGEGSDIDRIIADKELLPNTVKVPSWAGGGREVVGATSEPAAAKELNEKISLVNSIHDEIKSLESLGHKALTSASGRDAAHQKLANLKLNYLKFKNITRLSPEVMKITDKMFDDPTSLMDLIANGKTESLLSGMKSEIQNDLGSKLINYNKPYKPRAVTEKK